MERDSFVFYKSFHTALNGLPAEDYKRTLTAVCEYACEGIEPDLDGVPFMAFELIRPQIDANNKRYTDGKKGGRPRITTGYEKEKPLVIENENQRITKEKPNVNVNENVNVNDNDKDSIGAKTKRFRPPTVQEVEDYAREKGYSVDAERFVDFYESKGWVVGRAKMKDWKAAVRNWSRDKKPAKQGKLVNYDQRQIDYDSLLGIGG